MQSASALSGAQQRLTSESTSPQACGNSTKPELASCVGSCDLLALLTRFMPRISCGSIHRHTAWGRLDVLVSIFFFMCLAPFLLRAQLSRRLVYSIKRPKKPNATRDKICDIQLLRCSRFTHLRMLMLKGLVEKLHLTSSCAVYLWIDPHRILGHEPCTFLSP